MSNRWWIYQQERFPIFANGMLIAALSVSAVSYSALLRDGNPSWGSILAAFGITFLLFLQLRIADEFKDYEEDCRFRAYRPVPRGLVSLRELGYVGMIAAIAQAGLALGFAGVALLPYLFGVWLYLALMSREFFVPNWLKAHPIIYLVSHMTIMPLIYGLATACDWSVTTGWPPLGLPWFLAVSFCNGIIIEVGRKIRSPKDEEVGVETYSHLWGRKAAIFVWLSICTLTAVLAAIAGRFIGFGYPLALASWALVGFSGLIAAGFLHHPVAGAGKRLEKLSGLWTLFVYLGLGIVPLCLSQYG